MWGQLWRQLAPRVPSVLHLQLLLPTHKQSRVRAAGRSVCGDNDGNDGDDGMARTERQQKTLQTISD